MFIEVYQGLKRRGLLVDLVRIEEKKISDTAI